jgi:hypothetical protein
MLEETVTGSETDTKMGKLYRKLVKALHKSKSPSYNLQHLYSHS